MAEVARYLQTAFHGNSADAFAWALYATLVVRLPAVLAVSFALGGLSELLDQRWLGLIGLGVFQVFALVVVVMVVASWVGVFGRIGRRGQSELPLYGVEGLALLGNLVVRRLGPSWRQDTTYSVTTRPRPPRTKLGLLAHRVFWGPRSRRTWQRDEQPPP